MTRRTLFLPRRRSSEPLTRLGPLRLWLQKSPPQHLRPCPGPRPGPPSQRKPAPQGAIRCPHIHRNPLLPSSIHRLLLRWARPSPRTRLRRWSIQQSRLVIGEQVKRRKGAHLSAFWHSVELSRPISTLSQSCGRSSAPAALRRVHRWNLTELDLAVARGY